MSWSILVKGKLLAATLTFLLLLSPLSAKPVTSEPPLPDEITLNGVEFILIPEGWFYLSVAASHNYQEQYPMVRVWIDSYYLAKYEAEATDLVRFLNDISRTEPSFKRKLKESCVVQSPDSGEYFIKRKTPRLPANGLSWTQADAFARWMGFRLPTESEWEKAARGPNDKRSYTWGDEQPTHELVVGLNGYLGRKAPGCERYQPVNVLPAGRSPYGHFNMLGNVREFVEDWTDMLYSSVPNWLKDGMRNPPSDGRFTEKTHRMMKGGHWADNPHYLTIFWREPYEADQIAQANGVRFALDVDVVRKKLIKAQASISVEIQE